MDYGVSVDVRAPASRIWAVLTDVERWPEWTPSMTRLQRLEPGPLRVGSRVRVQQPRLPPATWQVTDLDEGEMFTWVAHSAGVRTAASHRVRATSAHVSAVTLSVEQSGPLAPLVSPLIAPLVRRYVELEAQGLKARCQRL